MIFILGTVLGTKNKAATKTKPLPSGKLAFQQRRQMIRMQSDIIQLQIVDHLLKKK